MNSATRKRTWRWTTWVRLFFSGWRPNRNVWDRLKLPRSFSLFPEAQRVLTEFGGLRFGDRNDYVDLNPALGEEGADEILPFEVVLETQLYPVGIMEHQDRIYIVIDEKGIVYTVCLDELKPFASSFDRAIECLAGSSVPRREREADLRSVGLFGKEWRPG